MWFNFILRQRQLPFRIHALFPWFDLNPTFNKRFNKTLNNLGLTFSFLTSGHSRIGMTLLRYFEIKICYKSVRSTALLAYTDDIDNNRSNIWSVLWWTFFALQRRPRNNSWFLVLDRLRWRPMQCYQPTTLQTKILGCTSITFKRRKR